MYLSGIIDDQPLVHGVVGHPDRAMKLHVDREADALYLRLDDSSIVESEEVSPGVVLD